MSKLPESVDKVLENVLDKPSKSIGETVADIWYLVLGGSINQMAEKRKMKYAAELKMYETIIQHEIEKIPESNRSEPNIQLIGKALEASKYCADKKKLRSMFARLIAGSIDKEKTEEVLPEYTIILENMNERMASDVIYLHKDMNRTRNSFPLVDIYQKCRNLYTELESEFTEDSKQKLEKMDDTFYSIMRRDVCEIDINSLRYFLNHGIIDIEEKYSPLVDYGFIDQEIVPEILAEEQISENDLKVRYKYFYVTDYGKQFFDIIM